MDSENAPVTLYMNRLRFAVLFLVLPFAATIVFAADPVEDDYYRITAFEVPTGVELEAGAFCPMPDGRMAVSSRRGEIWMIRDPGAKEVKAEQFQRFAHGLHEVLGLSYREGWLYVTQRTDVSRIKDTDGDGKADVFEVVCDKWGVNGDYHEYAFGSHFDRNGDIWVVLCLTGSFTSDDKFRGWCLRVGADGKMTPTCSGIRSPGGIGINAEGDVFYTDNQGTWNGTCEMKHLIPGKFVGNPAGNKWYELAPNMGPQPQQPMSGSRFVIEADKIPEYEPPSIQFPYAKMGQSASGIACDTTQGKFGPFAKQMFVSDQTASTVMRCPMEKIKGHWQGACIPFREGFGSGNVPMEMAADGSLYVGGTNRGWGSRGRKPFAVERLNWTGKVPFEILEMHAKTDGFELTFTQPVDPATASNVANYAMKTFTYIYQSSYGSPEVDPTTPEITAALVSPDNKSVRLKVNGLQRGHIHDLECKGVRSAEGLPLLHNRAYYTLNYLSDAT